MKWPSVEKAILDMQRFHAGQLDKSGVPYFHHPFRVMCRLGSTATDNERIAALFHDVVEDTETSLEDLIGLGYSEESVEMVDLLTRYKPDTHRQYLQRLIDSNNIGAMRIKLADMYDNSWVKRIEGCSVEVRDNLLDMIEGRYKPSIMLMKEVLGRQAAGIIEGDIEVEALVA